MQAVYYPPLFLYILIVTGIPLAVLKPFGAFILTAFLLSSADSCAFTLTRTSFFGPYFNVNDACLLIGMVAAVSYLISKREKMPFPKIILFMLIALLISFAQTWYVLKEISYDLLRSLRWALALPLNFLIAYVILDRKEKIKYFILALFIGAVVSAIQHFVFVSSYFPFFQAKSFNIEHIRTIAFRSPGIWFLLAAGAYSFKLKWLNWKIIFVSSILFLASVLLNQTRSIWISAIVSLPILILIFNRREARRRFMIVLLLILLLLTVIYFLMAWLMPTIDIFTLIRQRVESLANSQIRYETTTTRQAGFVNEMDAWSKGTLIFGRGLAYFMPIYYSGVKGVDFIGWGHLGHVTTLAQLGLFGLFIYSFYFPWIIIKASLFLWKDYSQDIKFLGLLTAACMISSWVLFIMSDCFLAQHAVEGLIFGGAWGIARYAHRGTHEKRYFYD